MIEALNQELNFDIVVINTWIFFRKVVQRQELEAPRTIAADYHYLKDFLSHLTKKRFYCPSSCRLIRLKLLRVSLTNAHTINSPRITATIELLSTRVLISIEALNRSFTT